MKDEEGRALVEAPIVYAVALTVIFLIAGTLPSRVLFADIDDYLPLHILLEFVSIIVALMVFALAWHLRGQTRPQLAILGVGFLCVALVDFGHMLSYRGMPDFVTPASPEKAIAFWLVARIVTAVTLLIAAFHPATRWRARHMVIGTGLALLVSALSFWAILARPDALPASFIPGQGLTAFKIGTEYLIVAMLGIAAIMLLRRSRANADPHQAWLGLAAWTLGLAELYFTLYNTVSDTHNVLGHLYKCLASWLIYRSVFVAGVREPTEHALRLNDRYESLIKATQAGTWIVDLETTRIDVNDQWARMLGYTVAELQPLTEAGWRAMVHPDDRDAALAVIEAAREHPPHEFRIEYRLKHQQGHWVWVLCMGSFMPPTEHAGRKASGFNIDISDRKQRELEIATQRRRLTDILEGTHVGTWEWQVQTGEVVFNERWAQILGYTLEELAPLSIDTWMKLAHPDDLAHSGALLEQHFAGDLEYYECEARMRHKDGHWVWVLDRGKVAQWDDQGQPVLMSGTHQDISDRKAMETELLSHREDLEHMVEVRTRDLAVAKDAAESASRAKTAFLSMASHELRTPMNGIMGTLALALRKTTQPEISTYLAKADRASKQLLGIINDVLDISRIESDRLVLASVRFTLDEILAHVHDALDGTATLKGLRFRSEVSATLAEQGYLGDPTRITQILMNLAGNALKFTAEGEVVIRINDLPDTTGAIRLHFEVSDTGIGIRPRDKTRIFEQFEQVDSSHTRKFGGTGLGLSLCKRLAEAMGGRIGVHSTFGEGSTFWFDVVTELLDAPADQAGTANPDAERLLRTRYAGTTVLLAEDEPFNQEIIGEMLEMVGMVVHTAGHGAEALEMARAGAYDLILMDLNMPGMGGIEATYAIRQFPAHAQTPIIALTANAFVEDRDACLRAGMNDHVGKPVAPEVLFGTVLKWLTEPATSGSD